MSIPIVLITLLSCISAVVAPWVGVIAYYLLAVGQLNALWPEHFGDSRASLFISLATILGLGVATAAQRVDWRRLLIMPNLLLMVVVAMVNISFSVNPYEGFEEIKKSALAPIEVVQTFNKIMLFYFVSVLLIDTRFKLICLLSAIAGVLLYYTLWANKIYITGEHWRFGDNGRLNGPFGIYYDENYLAMLFVLATPIFYYLSVGTDSRIIRYGLWISIPASWHALFLTSSRGALLSLAVVCAYIFFRSYSKRASVILILALVVAIVDQSGNMISRINDTVVSSEEAERDRAFIENNEDSPVITDQAADARILSWTVGFQIMRDHPMFGVGPGNFMRAYPDYDDSEPHVAHNTFVQMAATVGLASGFIYLYFLYLRVRNSLKKAKPDAKFAKGFSRDYLDDLINSLTFGFYCVALFLDLMVIEVTYFVILVIVSKYTLDRKSKASVRSMIESIYAWRRGATDKAQLVETEAAEGIAAYRDNQKRDENRGASEAGSGPIPNQYAASNNQYVRQG